MTHDGGAVCKQKEKAVKKFTMSFFFFFTTRLTFFIIRSMDMKIAKRFVQEYNQFFFFFFVGSH